MKKFINKINSKATELAIRTKTALASKSGEGYIDTAVKIIIGVVVGSVILVGLYAAVFVLRSYAWVFYFLRRINFENEKN